jgi:LysR family transcriptional regulator, chromosome initiation inhibitor
VRPLIESGALVNLAPQTELRVSLYWHCWNIDSAVLAALTAAVSAAAAGALKREG